nr:ABC transporter substrate-binding protein [Streptomyces antibioticus]
MRVPLPPFRARSANRKATLCIGIGASLMIAGCSGGGKGSGAFPAIPSPTTSVVGTAKANIAALNWGLPFGEPNTIDPPNTGYYSSSLVSSALCDNLLRLNADYSITDGVASLRKPDSRTLALSIRKGVKFWDGSQVTPADVVWSLEHARQGLTGFLFRNVDTIKASGPSEVTVRLTKPDSLLPKELASFAGAVQQKSFGEKAGKALGSPAKGLMCTGPYELKQWKPGSSIELEKNQHYWDPAFAAKAGHVSLKFLSDSTALTQALLSGEIDGAYEVPAALVPALSKATSGAVTFGAPSQLYLALSPTRAGGPLGSPELRKAFYMTIDRKALAKSVYHGAANYTALNVDVWNNPTTSAEAKAVWRKAYDSFRSERSDWGSKAALSQARSLAKKAGYQGQPITLAVLAGDATMNQAAVLMQASAKEAGFNVEIRPLDPAAYADAAANPAAREKLDLYLNVSFNVAPDALEATETFLPGTYFNFIGYKNQTVISLVERARATSDSTQQAKLLTEAQSIYEKNYGFQGLVQISEISFLKKGLGGATASFAYMNQPSLARIGSSK